MKNKTVWCHVQKPEELLDTKDVDVVRLQGVFYSLKEGEVVVDGNCSTERGCCTFSFGSLVFCRVATIWCQHELEVAELRKIRELLCLLTHRRYTEQKTDFNMV